MSGSDEHDTHCHSLAGTEKVFRNLSEALRLGVRDSLLAWAPIN